MRGSRCVLLAVCAIAAPVALGEVTVPPTRDVVVDLANVIDDGVEQRLSVLLTELRKKTTAEVKVLTVETTDGEAWFGWVQRHADAWKLGAAGKDNGVLIALAVKDRKVRIHVGYGLEGLMPDSWCGTVRRDATDAYLRNNDFTSGLANIAVTVANRIAEHAGVSLAPAKGIPGFSGRHSRRARGAGAGAGCCGGIVPLMALLVIFSSMGRRRRHYGRWGGGLWQGILLGSIFNSMSGGGRSSWGGGGLGGSGFGGGGFGGGGFFGGGGGFGGGGSGGSF